MEVLNKPLAQHKHIVYNVPKLKFNSTLRWLSGRELRSNNCNNENLPDVNASFASSASNESSLFLLKRKKNT